MVVRRRSAATAPPAIDTTATEVVIPPDTEAEVTEQIGAKTVSYKATVKGKPKDEENDEMDDEIFDDEDALPRYPAVNNRQSQEAIPKDKLTQLFDILSDEYGNEPFFFANVIRQPDALGDRFLIPCNTEMPLGVFQFSVTDRFTFLPELQRLSGSGGRYNVLVYSSEQKPLDTFVSFSYERGQRRPITQQLGVRNLLVPNPTIQKTEEPQSDLAKILSQFAETQQAQTRMILEAIQRANSPKEKSTLEAAIEQKVLNDLLNPQKPQTNEIEKTLATLLTMPAMAEGLARRMFPDAPAPDAPQGVVDRVLNNPEIVNKLIDTGGNIVGNLAHLAAMKMQSEAQPQAQPSQSMPQPIPISQPQPQPQQIEDNEMALEQSELVNEILVELETDNPINKDNPKLRELSERFPKIYPILTMAAKSMPFSDLLEQLETIVDFAEHGLLDEDGDFNPRGLAIKARLKTFYEFLRAQ